MIYAFGWCFFSRQMLNQSVTQILQQYCKLNQWREFKRHQRRKQMSLICNDAYLEQSTHHKISSYEVWACADFLFWFIGIPFSIDLFAQMGNKLNHNKILWVTKEFTELVSLLYLIFFSRAFKQRIKNHTPVILLLTS